MLNLQCSILLKNYLIIITKLTRGMAKIAMVMKSTNCIYPINDDNLNCASIIAIINSHTLGNSNFFYYKNNTHSISNVLCDAIQKLDNSFTHLLFVTENMMLSNLQINTDTNIGLFMDSESIDECSICFLKLTPNVKANISDMGQIEINYDLAKCCVKYSNDISSLNSLLKKIIEMNINYTNEYNSIYKNSLHIIDTVTSNPVLFIGTPCYGAQVSCNFTRSLIATIELLKSQHINVIVHFLPNQIVTRARNLLADYFLKSHCSHLLFIDADIEWKPEDVLKLIRHDKELGVGLYANKAYVGIKKDPNLFKNIQYSSTFFDNGHTMSPNNLLEIKHGATGFMLIKRCVFDTVREKTDEFLYSNVKMNDYFPCKVVDNDYLTEDYAFCQMWRETGGKVWADMSICLNHEGWHSYPGNPLATYSVDQKSVSSTKN